LAPSTILALLPLYCISSYILLSSFSLLYLSSRWTYMPPLPLACSFDNSYFLLLPLLFSSSSLLTHFSPCFFSPSCLVSDAFCLTLPSYIFSAKLLPSKHAALIIFSLLFLCYAGTCSYFQSWFSSFLFFFPIFSLFLIL
jgi:hypothetical protein